MIPKNLQHELFEKGERNRLVYLVNPFEGDAERTHSKRIEDLERADDDSVFDDVEIAKLKEGITELKRQIKELQHLLYVEDPDNPLDFVLDDDGLKEDEVAIRGGYGTDDYAPFGSALQVATGSAGENASADFQIEFDTYRRTFEDIRAMTFKGQIADWIPKGGDQSEKIPEIGLENFADLLTNPQLTIHPRDDSGLMNLYNEHGLEIQVPSTMAEIRPEGNVLDMRNEAIRRESEGGEAGGAPAYLLPIWYGGQELYISSQDVKVPNKEDFKLGDYDAVNSKYMPSVVDGLEVPFGRDIFPDGHSWDDVMQLARAYEMARAGGAALYKENLFGKGLAQFSGTPNGGDYATAMSYASQVLKLDPQFTDAHYLLARALVGLKQYGAAKAYIAAYDGAPDSGFKSRPAGIARLKLEVEAYETAQLEDVPAHPEPILARLGGDANILYSTRLRGELVPLKERLTDPIRENIDDYDAKREELEQAMEIEIILANEYFDRADDQPTADLLELYFLVKGKDLSPDVPDIYLVSRLSDQLTREGGILHGLGEGGPKFKVITSLVSIIPEFVISQIEERGIDLDSAATLERFNNLEALKETLPPLFLSGSETFDGLDTNDDGIVILEIEGKIYAIEREVTELEVEMRGVFYDAIDAELKREIEYLEKDFTKGLGGKEQTDPLGGELNALFKGDPLGQAAQKAHAKQLGKKMGLIGEPTVPEVKAALEQLNEDLAGELFNPHGTRFDLTSYTRGFKYLAAQDTRLAPFSEKTQAKIREYAGRASAYESGDKSQGGRIRLEMRYLSKDGEVHTNTHEAPATMLRAIEEEVNLPILQAGLRTASMDPSMQLPKIQRTADEARGVVKKGPKRGTKTSEGTGGGGEEPPEEPGPPEPEPETRGPKDPLGRAVHTLLASLIRRPEPTEVTPEMTVPERRETVKGNTEAMNKYRIEKLVYRGPTYKEGGENPQMVKVFAESRVKDLMDFHDQVEAMRDGGSDKRTHKDSWGAKFRGLLKGAVVKVSDSGDIHLIGRPLILYNTIRRAIEEGNRNNVTMEHGFTGDQWLGAMAKRQYAVSHEGASDLEDIPPVHPEYPDRIESPEAIMTDIFGMKRPEGSEEPEERGYMVYVTSSGRDTPYVFKVKRTKTHYEIDYGDRQPAHFVNDAEVGDKFVHGILMDKLEEGRKGGWTDFHAFRVGDVSELTPQKLAEYHREFMENITLEESNARVERRTELLLKEISKDSKLPLPRLKKLLEERHSSLVAKVADIYMGGEKGPRKHTLDKFEYAAAKLYLEKMGYKFGKKKSDGKTPDFSVGSVSKKDSNPAIDHLRGMVSEEIENEGTASADDLIPEEEESERLAGKETDKPAPAHRASAMEKLAALGVEAKLARRAKRIYTKFVDHLWANSGGITSRRMDYIRFGFPAKEYKNRMGNRLAIAEFGNMIGKIEGGRTRGGGRTQGLRAAILYQIDTRNLPLFTSNNTVDDALLRMAAITALAETQELSCSVAYVLGDSDRAGPKIADRGEGYASPRVRRSVYRPYV